MQLFFVQLSRARSLTFYFPFMVELPMKPSADYSTTSAGPGDVLRRGAGQVEAPLTPSQKEHASNEGKEAQVGKKSYVHGARCKGKAGKRQVAERRVQEWAMCEE